MEASNDSAENSRLLSQEEFERNMEAFQRLAGIIEAPKPRVITRSRSRMKEDLNIKTSDSECDIQEEELSKIKKKKSKSKRNDMLKKLKLARNIITMDKFKEVISKQLEEQDNSNVCFDEDAMKIFHDGILLVMINYFENVKETLEANTLEKATLLESKRLLGE